MTGTCWTRWPRFAESYELAPDLYASPELLQALDGAMQTLDGQTFVLDQQMQTALELCKLAAEEPATIYRAARRQLEEKLSYRLSWEEDRFWTFLCARTAINRSSC